MVNYCMILNCSPRGLAGRDDGERVSKGEAGLMQGARMEKGLAGVREE